MTQRPRFGLLTDARGYGSAVSTPYCDRASRDHSILAVVTRAGYLPGHFFVQSMAHSKLVTTRYCHPASHRNKVIRIKFLLVTKPTFDGWHKMPQL